MTDALPSTRCQLCGRRTPAAQLTKHHLRPRSRGGVETALLCGTCHNQIHATFTNKELEAEYDTLAKLRDAPEMQKFLGWIRKQKPGRQFRGRR